MVMSWSRVRGPHVELIRLSIWKIDVEIHASRCSCLIGKEQRAGLVVYLGHMSSWLLF